MPILIPCSFPLDLKCSSLKRDQIATLLNGADSPFSAVRISGLVSRDAGSYLQFQHKNESYDAIRNVFTSDLWYRAGTCYVAIAGGHRFNMPNTLRLIASDYVVRYMGGLDADNPLRQHLTTVSADTYDLAVTSVNLPNIDLNAVQIDAAADTVQRVVDRIVTSPSSGAIMTKIDLPTFWLPVLNDSPVDPHYLRSLGFVPLTEVKEIVNPPQLLSNTGQSYASMYDLNLPFSQFSSHELIQYAANKTVVVNLECHKPLTGQPANIDTSKANVSGKFWTICINSKDPNINYFTDTRYYGKLAKRGQVKGKVKQYAESRHRFRITAVIAAKLKSGYVPAQTAGVLNPGQLATDGHKKLLKFFKVSGMRVIGE
jgi:predicted DNA-binding WGR domain protein